MTVPATPDPVREALARFSPAQLQDLADARYRRLQAWRELESLLEQFEADEKVDPPAPAPDHRTPARDGAVLPTPDRAVAGEVEPQGEDRPTVPPREPEPCPPGDVLRLAEDELREYYGPFSALLPEEVGTLVRMWETRWLDTHAFEFLSSQSEWRDKARAAGRLRGLRYALTDEEYDEIRDEVERELRSRFGAGDWRVIRAGSREERESLRERLSRARPLLGDDAGLPARQLARELWAAQPGSVRREAEYHENRSEAQVRTPRGSVCFDVDGFTSRGETGEGEGTAGWEEPGFFDRLVAAVRAIGLDPACLFDSTTPAGRSDAPVAARTAPADLAEQTGPGSTGPVPPPVPAHADGDSRLYVGDCRTLLPSLPDRPRFVFADPPFNIGQRYQGYRDRASAADYARFTAEWVRAAEEVLDPEGVLVVHVPDAVVPLVLRAARLPRIAWVIWHYRFGQCTRANWIASKAHCLVFSPSPGRHTWNPDAVLVPSDRLTRYADPRTARSRTPGRRVPFDVWGLPDDGPHWGRVQGNNRERRTGHPNQLPEVYLERLVRAYTNPGDLVLDPFAGSGTTLVVARALGRPAVGIDVSAAAVDSAWQRVCAGSVRVTPEPSHAVDDPGPAGSSPPA